MELILAVKDIVRFLYQSGDLTNELANNDIGKDIHTYWQKGYKKDIDIKEYYVKKKFKVGDYDLTIHGFIDGLLNNGLVIEEIKKAFIECLSLKV